VRKPIVVVIVLSLVRMLLSSSLVCGRIAETPDDGRLRPKRDVSGRSDGNSCIVDGIMSCVKRYQHF
jgi:hypothetical protein